MLENIIEAILIVLSWPTILFVVIGVTIGLVFGAIPGLGGVIAVALLVPFTFGLQAENAIVLFGATIGGVAFGGSVSAILINIPGTAPNVATLIDGYPMTRSGRSAEALAVSATASAIGAIFGVLVLLSLLPVAREVVLAFSAPEFFWLAIIGLVVIAVTTRESLLKGLIAGGVGFIFALAGYSEVTGETRYAFGITYLWDGVELIPAIIGLYAIGEVINFVTRGGEISERRNANLEGSILTGIKQVTTRPFLLLRSAVIGILVGLVPGIGGVTANFISYMQASQTSQNSEQFGKGDPRGVLASEAANDAKDGGALLPTVAFGIPGSAVMAVILGGLLLHGVTPGQQLLQDDLTILLVLIFALLLSNILTSIIGLSTANHLAKITRVDVNLLAPIILVVSLIGTYVLRLSIGDMVIAVLFGFLGYAFIALNYSRIPVVLALILATITEVSYHQALMISDGNHLIFVTRPISAVLMVLTVISLVYPFRNTLYNITSSRFRKSLIKDTMQSLRNLASIPNRLGKMSQNINFSDRSLGWLVDSNTEDFDRIFTGLLLVFMMGILLKTLAYEPDTQLFPLLIGIPTIVLIGILALVQASPDYTTGSEGSELLEEYTSFQQDDSEVATRTKRERTLMISQWVITAFLIMYVIGMSAGSLIFLFIYYYYSTSLSKAIKYSLVIWLIIVVVFVIILGAHLYEGLILDILL